MGNQNHPQKKNQKSLEQKQTLIQRKMKNNYKGGLNKC
jgi:hypothetical protein